MELRLWLLEFLTKNLENTLYPAPHCILWTLSRGILGHAGEGPQVCSLSMYLWGHTEKETHWTTQTEARGKGLIIRQQDMRNTICDSVKF